MIVSFPNPLIFHYYLPLNFALFMTEEKLQEVYRNVLISTYKKASDSYAPCL
jgi:hypothetical protein